MKKNPKIEFYKTGVFSVLKRYDFSQEEKQVINAAILTAKKKTPNMALIDKSDTLLKQITSKHKPKDAPLNKTDIVKMTANAQANYRSTRAKNERVVASHGKYALMWTFVGAIVISFLTAQVMKANQPNWYIEDYGLHTYEEAQKICRDDQSTFPTAELVNKVYDESDILTRISQYRKNEAYWVNGGNVYSIRDSESTVPNEDKKYQTRCYDDASSIFQ